MPGIENCFKKHTDLNCYDSVIANVGKMFDRNITLFFLNAFGFMYEHPIDQIITLGTIIWNSNSNYFYTLKHFCGINAVNTDICRGRDLQDLLRNCIESNMYIGIRVDSSDLTWSKKTYFNRLHNILVINHDDRGFSVADSYLLDSLISVPHSFFETVDVKEITIFSLTDSLKPDRKTVAIFLMQIAERFLQFDVPSLKDFGVDILSLNMDRGVNVVNIESAYLILGLSNICWSRKNFKDALTYFFQISDIYDKNILLDYLDESLRLWLKIKHMILKYCFTKKHTLLTEVSEHIKSVTVVESKIAFYLITQFE